MQSRAIKGKNIYTYTHRDKNTRIQIHPHKTK